MIDPFPEADDLGCELGWPVVPRSVVDDHERLDPLPNPTLTLLAVTVGDEVREGEEVRDILRFGERASELEDRRLVGITGEDVPELMAYHVVARSPVNRLIDEEAVPAGDRR